MYILYMYVMYNTYPPPTLFNLSPSSSLTFFQMHNKTVVLVAKVEIMAPSCCFFYLIMYCTLAHSFIQ